MENKMVKVTKVCTKEKQRRLPQTTAENVFPTDPSREKSVQEHHVDSAVPAFSHCLRGGKKKTGAR